MLFSSFFRFILLSFIVLPLSASRFVEEGVIEEDAIEEGASQEEFALYKEMWVMKKCKDDLAHAMIKFRNPLENERMLREYFRLVVLLSSFAVRISVLRDVRLSSCARKESFLSLKSRFSLSLDSLDLFSSKVSSILGVSGSFFDYLPADLIVSQEIVHGSKVSINLLLSGDDFKEDLRYDLRVVSPTPNKVVGLSKFVCKFEQDVEEKVEQCVEQEVESKNFFIGVASSFADTVSDNVGCVVM